MYAWQNSDGDMHLNLLDGASAVSQPDGSAMSVLQSIAVGGEPAATSVVLLIGLGMVCRIRCNQD
jgi:hypothetical protein